MAQIPIDARDQPAHPVTFADQSQFDGIQIQSFDDVKQENIRV